MQGHAHQQGRLSGHGSCRRDVVLIDKGGHHHVQSALGMIGNINEDEQVTPGAWAEVGELSQASQVVDGCPNFGEPCLGGRHLGGGQELPSRAEVAELDLVWHWGTG